MNTKEFEALEVGDAVKYAKERAEFVVIKKFKDGTYKAECTRLVATADLWEKVSK